MLETTLTRLGFDKKEILIYTTLLKTNRMIASDISKNTGINRTTVYTILKELLKKSVVKEDLAGKSTYFIAQPINNFNSWIKKEKEKLIRKEKLVKKASEESEKIKFENKYSIPKLRFIDENDLETFLEKEVDSWNKSASSVDNSWWGFQDPTFVKNFDNWIKNWYYKKSSKTIIVRLLSNHEKIEDEIKKFTDINKDRRFINFIDREDAKFASTIWVIGNYIIMINTKNKPFYAIDIYNESLATNLREMFKILWRKTN